MADIAMLVAEEYERRVKSSRNAAEVDLSSALVSNCVGFLGGEISLRRFSSVWVKEKVTTVLMQVLEPKSQMSVAASHGFFSA